VGNVVERYLRSLVDHDWDALDACLADDVVRIGPFGDTYEPKAPYMAFITKLMPSLEGYDMRVDRIVDSGDVVVAELTETVEIGGTVYVTPEALIFGLDSDGLIAKVDIFIKTLGEAPAAAGGDGRESHPG
jgi:ketosteroid isomerase-like protein